MHHLVHHDPVVEIGRARGIATDADADHQFRLVVSSAADDAGAALRNQQNGYAPDRKAAEIGGHRLR